METGEGMLVFLSITVKCKIKVYKLQSKGEAIYTPVWLMQTWLKQTIASSSQLYLPRALKIMNFPEKFWPAKCFQKFILQIKFLDLWLHTSETCSFVPSLPLKIYPSQLHASKLLDLASKTCHDSVYQLRWH